MKNFGIIILYHLDFKILFYTFIQKFISESHESFVTFCNQQNSEAKNVIVIDESEILLQAGLKFKVTKFEKI